MLEYKPEVLVKLYAILTLANKTVQKKSTWGKFFATQKWESKLVD